jgi:NAD(P)-dependent dehydrogenase (short-subunit alcohol dehydrogenase family)
MSERLKDRVAFVFGAGSGDDGVSNGQAAAVTYAREGARVAAVDISQDAVQRTVDLIQAEGGQVVGLTADVTDNDQVAAVVARAASELGPADVLHNNVGATVLGGPVNLPYVEWQRAFAINVDGVFLTCKHVLPAMIEKGRGAIVNVSSIAGLRHVGYEYPAYMASKAAVNQLTVSLAITHAGQGVRANAVAPGFIDTPLVRRQLSTQAATIEELRGTPRVPPAGWVRHGTWRRPVCSWLLTKRLMSTVSAYLWTVD